MFVRRLYPNKLKNWPIGGLKLSRLSVNFSVYLGVFVLFCLLAFVVPKLYSNQKKQFLDKIRQIPASDRWVIESFLKILMLQENGAYVLFGDKPVVYTAFYDFSTQEVYSAFCRKSWLVNKQIRQGWEAWEKYAHLFPSNRFLLKGTPSDDHQRVEIVLIDKEKFKNKFEEYLHEFQSILGKDVTASSLLSRYKNEKLMFFDLLKKHHALLGILLGYGSENSWLFHLKDRVYEDIYRNDFQPSLRVNSAKEYAEYQKLFTSSFPEKNHQKPYKFLYLPMFLVNPKSKETKELREKYLRQREHIHRVYCHGNFLEITLECLCS
jgi:hypothetical protein